MRVRPNVVWLSPGATSFSCLCEKCVETAREAGLSFLDAVRVANVRGTLPVETQMIRTRCASGHELVLQRGERPAGLVRHDPGQLQLA